MRRMLWVVWGAATLAGGAYLAAGVAAAEASRNPWLAQARAFLLPGKTTNGHYQIELACESCHTSPFASKDDLQQACVQCHGAELKAANDTHPLSKFTDPRNADRLEKLDATLCVTCHIEHRPRVTHAMGLTLPKDICFHCHAEIGTDRPSHAGMGFETCNSAGCHKYHDNRALYEDFMAKRLDQPATLPEPRMPARDLRAAIAAGLTTYPAERRPLHALERPDAPKEVRSDASIEADWRASAHAAGGVNCSGCHQPSSAAAWVERPDRSQCASCHDAESNGFLAGKHGMRSAAKLSPMTPGLARSPMHADARDRTLGCSSCHSAHRADTRVAAAQACLECHDDRHSRAYEMSAHYRLWRAEQAGAGPSGSGVSCASCHMPRIAHELPNGKRTLVQHNQNDNLRPNEKMLRSVCLNCHGLGFSIDALADPNLVASNFTGKPKVHIRSLDLVAERVKQAEERRKRRSAQPADQGAR